MFHQVRIPRQNLLNRLGDVTPEGTYVSSFKVQAPLAGSVSVPTGGGRRGQLGRRSVWVWVPVPPTRRGRSGRPCPWGGQMLATGCPQASSALTSLPASGIS